MALPALPPRKTLEREPPAHAKISSLVSWHSTRLGTFRPVFAGRKAECLNAPAAVPRRPRRQPAAAAGAAARRARRTPPAGSTTPSCGRSRTRRSARSCACRRRSGLQSATDGEFRRASWHMDFIYRSAASRKAPGDLDRSQFRNAEGDDRVHARPRCASTAASGWSETIFGDDFALPAATRDDGADAEADDPVAEHGPLPRRAGGDRRVASIPTWTAFWADLTAAYAEEVAAARRARLHATCSSTTRASPT